MKSKLAEEEEAKMGMGQTSDDELMEKFVMTVCPLMMHAMTVHVVVIHVKVVHVMEIDVVDVHALMVRALMVHVNAVYAMVKCDGFW